MQGSGMTHMRCSISLGLYFLSSKIIGLMPDSPRHRTITGIKPDNRLGRALKRKEGLTDATWHLAWEEKFLWLYITDFCIMHEPSGN